MAPTEKSRELQMFGSWRQWLKIKEARCNKKVENLLNKMDVPVWFDSGLLIRVKVDQIMIIDDEVICVMNSCEENGHIQTSKAPNVEFDFDVCVERMQFLKHTLKT